MLFSDERITLDSEIKAETEEFDETSLHMRQLLKTKLVDMDLSVRALNNVDLPTFGSPTIPHLSVILLLINYLVKITVYLTQIKIKM